MNDSSPNKGSQGRLVRADSVTTTPFEVDFEIGEGIAPSKPWSTGKLVRVCESLPLVSGDFIPAAEACFEITVRLTPDADPGKVMLFATRMIQNVNDHFPELGLKYDPARSRAQAGTVVIGLASSKGEEAEQKLEAVAQAIRTLVEGFPMATLNGVRLTRAA